MIGQKFKLLEIWMWLLLFCFSALFFLSVMSAHKMTGVLSALSRASVSPVGFRQTITRLPRENLKLAVNVTVRHAHGNVTDVYRFHHANPFTKLNRALLGAIKQKNEDLVWRFYSELSEAKQLKGLSAEQHSMALRSFRLKRHLSYGSEEIENMKNRILFIVENMKALKINLDLRDYNHLLDFFGRAGDWQACTQYWETMMAEPKGLWGVNPDILSYNLFMRGALQGKKPHEVFNVLELMRVAKVEPNLFTYTTLIEAHGLLGDIRSADAVYQKTFLDTQDSPESAPGFFSFLSFQGGKQESTNVAARAVLDLLPITPQSGVLKPDTSVFVALINAHGRHKNLKGLEYIQQKMMPAAGVQPDIKVYNALIRWYCRHSEIDSVKQIFGEMETNNIKPNITSFNYLFRHEALKEKQTRKAEQLLDLMKRVYNITPITSMYRILMKIHYHHNRKDDAKRVYDDYNKLNEVQKTPKEQAQAQEQEQAPTNTPAVAGY
ncbi:hypothetical protein CLU79DRAFT_737906 [Phycomyces nitens]|nr:hypothetical protein CLU79DRAFT_737906 [Phycomyces nitens]